MKSKISLTDDDDDDVDDVNDSNKNNNKCRQTTRLSIALTNTHTISSSSFKHKNMTLMKLFLSLTNV